MKLTTEHPDDLNDFFSKKSVFNQAGPAIG